MEIFKTVPFLFLIAVINVAAHCPDNWTTYRNKCYLLFPEQKEWGSALNTCLAYGGHLASPSTSDEHNFINNYIIGYNPNFLWLGGNDQVSLVRLPERIG